MNVYAKLNEAREEFHSLELKKTGHNKFAGYNYFELGDFLIPALKVFKKHGLCGTISFNKDFAKMCVVNIEKPDEYIPFESPMGSAALKGCHEVQNIGAVETYQRRYLWVAALEIVEHDALDATTGSDKKIAGPVGVMGAVLDELAPLTPAEKAYYAELAEIVVSMLLANGPAAANERIKMENLDADQRAQLESFLDSKTRSALGKASGKDLPKAKYTF
jgi:hypothetical protein